MKLESREINDYRPLFPDEINSIFAAERLVEDLLEVNGGAPPYPEAVDLSDHAPVVADFRASR